MRYRQTAFLGLALLGGCSAYHGLIGPTASATFTADGRAGYSISCDGTRLSWESCTDKAGELCKDRGYDIIEKRDWGYPVSRTMLVACKN